MRRICSPVRKSILPKVPDIKFLADEGFSFPISSMLQKMGYDVKWIGDIASGADDTVIFEISREDGRVILTEDKDFGELET